MSIIPNHKFGICHCGECPTDQEVAGRKPAKTFMCLRSYNAMKSKEQQEKANQRNKVRMLSSSNNKSGNNKSAYKQVDDKLVDNEAAKRLKRLNVFFELCAESISKNPYCLNCSEPITYITGYEKETGWSERQMRDFRNATAHLLPKGIFHSIETHPLCWLPLGAKCGCHNDTHRLDKFSQMRIFPQAVQQFRQIEHLITEKHKLLDEFKSYADKI